MKKKELMILVPPEMTPDLMETARQDTPVKSEHWASDKKYKYGRYFLAKKEKGYLIVSVFLAQYVRAGAKYPTYVVYFDKKADDFITFETDSGKWRESMLSNLDWPRYIYASGIYMSQQDENLIQEYLKTETASYKELDRFQRDVRERRLLARHKRKTDVWDAAMKPVPGLPKDWKSGF